MRPNGHTIALLRPRQTSWTAFYQAESKPSSEIAEAYNEGLDIWIDDFRDQMAAVADNLGMQVSVHEFQLHAVSDIPGQRHLKLIQEADVITTIDPSEALIAYIRGAVVNHPQMRAVIACTTDQEMESLFTVLGTTKCPVLERKAKEVLNGSIISIQHKVERREVPKMFAFPHDKQDRMKHALTQALRFPHCNTVQQRAAS